MVPVDSHERFVEHQVGGEVIELFVCGNTVVDAVSNERTGVLYDIENRLRREGFKVDLPTERR